MVALLEVPMRLVEVRGGGEASYGFMPRLNSHAGDDGDLNCLSHKMLRRGHFNRQFVEL